MMMNFQRVHLHFDRVPSLVVTWLVSGLMVAHAAETHALFPGITPTCSCESLTNVSLPNTTIDSAVVDASNQMCQVTAIVTHPSTSDRVKIWIGLPLTNWNGRFQGTGGGGFLGGTGLLKSKAFSAGPLPGG